NRGEIALRIIRACRELGVQTVAVYSQEDADVAYLQLADDMICIGPGPASESYLNIPRIISAAEIADVQAIHPGYGFLAENAHFAEICRSCKIEFIGPSAASMNLLGNKVAARKLAKEAKVPVKPASETAVDEDQAIKIAQQIGYPVMIKAAGGGGGRGMRQAHNEISLRAGLKAAQAEAQAAFNDSNLYIEKLIEQARHVEVQVLGDMQGNIIQLGERDCTLQRRYQKLVEETPSPAISEETRRELGKSAVRLMRKAEYFSAGTVEFLIDQKGDFSFLEVNTRIQVEHPVTEMATGVDLLKWQIRIAAGEPLTLQQRDIKPRGVAIECRINAEDPANNFRPCAGTIEQYRPPGGPRVRMDTHVYSGYRISPCYDSCIGKLIVHQSDRAEAIGCMRRALDELHIEPIKTTIPLLKQIFNHRDFLRAKVDTEFIERTW
ncbi:MAG: acetyl-CoA carboxylase biotin carboxylase subunit, partial [Gammaproteobacteria bacterium]|nr:acetyl-CoA carboxylase biotin carboxylase subunit [Gammaproteobacteria bacterium]